MESHQEEKSGVLSQKHSKETLWASITSASKVEPPTVSQTKIENSSSSSDASEGIEANETLGSEVTAVAGETWVIETSKSGTPCPPFFPKKKILDSSVAATLPDAAPANIDVYDASLVPVVIESSNGSSSTNASASTELNTKTEVVTKIARFPYTVPAKLKLFLGQDGKAYAEMESEGNSYAVLVGSKRVNNAIREIAQNEGLSIRKSDINEVNHFLQAQAETARVLKSVWNRVGPVSGGFAIDIGDELHTHIQITAGNVEIVRKGSSSLFHRTAVSRPMVMPAEVGNLSLLKKYLNLNTTSIILLTAWISYTLAHPKVSTSKYLILVLMGNYGSGKSFICWIIQQLIDPSQIGVQIMPANATNLSIAANNAHVLFYDNLREISPAMSDILCIAATGGTLSSRELYTNADQNVLKLHVAMVLNGIHPFISQPDLNQRCLLLELLPIDESKRKSETQLAQEFQQDLPEIMRGLFDLISQIFVHLPTAKVTKPERMFDFSQWLAAMEVVNGFDAGDYQGLYSDTLKQGQLDSILDNILAATVLEFAKDYVKGTWTGTPAELLIELSKLLTKDAQSSKEWPKNAISMSKRLAGLQASLKSQKVLIESGRGKERIITIKSEGNNVVSGEVVNLTIDGIKSKGKRDDF